MEALKDLKNLTLLLFLVFALSTCNPGPGPDPGVGVNQQIFETWRYHEIIRKGCYDANNNLRRPCLDCPLLVMKTDNTFHIEDKDQRLLHQGTFRVVDDNEIIFDPGIFTTMGVSMVRYNLRRGSLTFDYTDGNTDCNVTEAYLVNGNNVAGD